MYQAGINKITLIENKGVDFTHYDPLNERAITAITSTGEQIEIENLQQPKFNIEINISDSGNVVYNYELEYLLFGFIQDNFTLIESLRRSLVGYCVLLEMYDGNYKFYNTPLFVDKSDIDPNEEMTFSLKFKNPVPSKIYHLDYLPGVSTTPIYRADTTILTADSTIYTSDYAL